MTSRTVLAVLLAASLGGAAYGQSLGEVAAREKERRAREKAKGTAKTYTNDDLEKGRPPGSTSKTQTSEPGSGRESESRSESGEGSGRVREGGPSEQEEWQRRAADIRAAAKDAQTRISALEARIADLQLDRNPNSADLLDPNRLQKREAEKAAAIQELDKAKADLAATQTDRAKLEEDARTQRIPSAWIQ